MLFMKKNPEKAAQVFCFFPFNFIFCLLAFIFDRTVSIERKQSGRERRGRDWKGPRARTRTRDAWSATALYAAHEGIGASKCLLLKVKLMWTYFHLQLSWIRTMTFIVLSEHIVYPFKQMTYLSSPLHGPLWTWSRNVECTSMFDRLCCDRG